MSNPYLPPGCPGYDPGYYEPEPEYYCSCGAEYEEECTCLERLEGQAEDDVYDSYADACLARGEDPDDED